MKSTLAGVVGALVFCLLSLAGGPAAAQDPPRAEFSAGYQLLLEESETIPLGWYADIAGNLTRVISVVGLVSGAYESVDASEAQFGISADVEGDASLHMFMGGARFSARGNPAWVPFAHVLAGAVHAAASVSGTITIGGQTETIDESFSSNEFALLAGGGVNLRMTDAVWLRVGGDYVRILDDGGANIFRFSAGLAFPF